VDPPTLTLISRSPEETQEIGKALGTLASPGDLFLLVGELGAGKTCMTQGIAWGLGVNEYVRSPTFVMVTQYQGRMTLYHIDLYRLETMGELLDLGLEEYFHGRGCCVVEWADRGKATSPAEHLVVRLEHLSESARQVRIEGKGMRYAKYLDYLRALNKSHGTGH